jgi:hypothetical protein
MAVNVIFFGGGGRLITAFAWWSCYNKALQTEWYKQLKFVFLKFWRLEV